jgi:hypothetical protein
MMFSLLKHYYVVFFHVVLSFTECHTGTPTAHVESYSIATRLRILLWRRDDARQLSVWNPCSLSGKIVI